MLGRLGLVATAVCFTVAPARAEQFLVHTQAEYAAASKRVSAGDTITLANGTWRDFDLVITGQGSQKKPVTVKAQTPGQVLLTGQSSLRLSGRHVIVSGLVFKDGHSPRG
jgi:poly(beta-D-mannuronate) lyase